MLYFNSDKFDFWKINEAIKYYYPIGVKKDESKMYFSYPGLKELEDIVVDNIHDDNHFIKRWVNFNKEIEKEIGKEIIGTTYGQAPSFSSYVLLDTVSVGDLTRTKELHFFVSLVGPFYSVVGQDNNAIKIDDHRSYKSTNYLVVSPEREFADIFKVLCEKIEIRFKCFRFVPFEICQQTIEGLSVRYTDENLNSIFHALFNNHVDLTIMRKFGNDYFKAEDWIKEGYVDTGGGWAIYPPTT
ncbi:MAG: hypothetical protein IT214_09500 [Chitinophagaceae bacterium]|nr:hypothetical protein [Chitinophagaceae bacterium]